MSHPCFEMVNRKEYNGGVGSVSYASCITLHTRRFIIRPVSLQQHTYLLVIKSRYSECMYLADNFASKIIKNGQVLAERHEVMIIPLPTIIASPLLRAGCPDTAKKVRTTKSVRLMAGS